jgi:hypothetical protein
MTTIQIDVLNGKVICGKSGGHLRVPHGTAITWTSNGSDKKFELEFFQLGVEAADSSQELQHWPFEEPAGRTSKPANSFTGTLRKLEPGSAVPVYKYNVKVGDLVLDPIIIVDR